MTLKQETADIIEKFADKSLTEGCLVLTEYDVKKTVVRDTDFYVEWAGKMREDERPFVYNVQEDKSGDKVYLKKIIGHPVFIGTVLKKMLSTELHDNDKAVLRLTYLWENCGIDKSLNEIFVGKTYKRRGGGSTDNEVFMDDSVQALLEFIKRL